MESFVAEKLQLAFVECWIRVGRVEKTENQE